jgi:hypothetical protein
MDGVLNAIGSVLCFVALCMLLLAFMKKKSKKVDE